LAPIHGYPVVDTLSEHPAPSHRIGDTELVAHPIGFRGSEFTGMASVDVHCVPLSDRLILPALNGFRAGGRAELAVPW